MHMYIHNIRHAILFWLAMDTIEEHLSTKLDPFKNTYPMHFWATQGFLDYWSNVIIQV